MSVPGPRPSEGKRSLSPVVIEHRTAFLLCFKRGRARGQYFTREGEAIQPGGIWPRLDTWIPQPEALAPFKLQEPNPKIRSRAKTHRR